MDDEANVALVHAHTESIGGADEVYFAAHKIVLDLHALLFSEGTMIDTDGSGEKMKLV